MLCLETRLQRKKTLRAIGFDDAPFPRGHCGSVNIAGVICAGTRLEGMVWGQAEKDGTDATDALARMLMLGKFADQVHLVLIDGLAVGGFNLIDLPLLAQRIQRPCITIMRKAPDFEAIERALQNFDDGEQRLAIVRKAGKVYMGKDCFFQVCGCEPAAAALAIAQLTDTGHVPEALRLAHLIGAAVMTGESSRRA